MSSDRELQFKQFKLKCKVLCKAASAVLSDSDRNGLPEVAPTSILDLASTTLTDHTSLVASTLRTLASDMGESYRSFPLLCSRTPQRFTEPEDTTTTPTTTTPPTSSTSTPTPTPTPTATEITPLPSKTIKQKKKKKKKKPPLPAWKRELQERRGLRKTTPPVLLGEEKESTENKQAGKRGDNICRRTVAVSYNKTTNSVRWGVSGQLKNQKIHQSIWGKSLIKGRPRGTCAEFHVVNESLLAEEGVEDMYMYVSDLIEGSAKPRCRNCLYISSNAQCFSDALVFDGKTDKQSKFEWKGGLKFKE